MLVALMVVLIHSIFSKVSWNASHVNMRISIILVFFFCFTSSRWNESSVPCSWLSLVDKWLFSCLPTCTYSLSLESGANLVHKKKKKGKRGRKKRKACREWGTKMLSLAGEGVNGAQLPEQKVSFKVKWLYLYPGHTLMRPFAP